MRRKDKQNSGFDVNVRCAKKLGNISEFCRDIISWKGTDH